MSGVKQLRGLVRLVGDAIDGGSRAIEKVQKRTARRTFDVLEAIPVVAPPAQAVHVVHDACVGLSHASIRGVARVVGIGLDAALDVAERCYVAGPPGSGESSDSRPDGPDEPPVPTDGTKLR